MRAQGIAAIRPATWALLVAAAAAAVTARVDPWEDTSVVAPLSSTQTGSRRLLPLLAEADVARATIVLRPALGPAVQLVPDPRGGHQVLSEDTPLGPADPEALDGLWSSLGMATTVRAVAEDSDVEVGSGGQIVVSWPGQQRTMSLGATTADDAGVYGSLQGGVEGTQGTWVFERELSLLVEQAPRAWVSRRAIVAETSHIEGVRIADGTELVRGPDGLWRSDGALLQTQAVKARIDRVLSARLDPLLDPARDLSPDAGTPQPWITLTDIAGGTSTLSTAGPCPGRQGRVVLVRGEGLAGCIDSALLSPWPREQWLNPVLAPHGYAEVLSIAQSLPAPRSLVRHGGGWRLEETLGERQIATEVDESEVFRWYGELHDAEVEPLQVTDGVGVDGAGVDGTDTTAPVGPPAVSHTLSTEHGVTMTLACWSNVVGGPLQVCRRDAGPWLALRQPLRALALDPELFSDRRLVSALSVDDARAIEILAGPASPGPTRRQSAHFDLGVWRLDAPTHPDGDDAMDSTKLEALLAAVAGLRAQRWAEPPASAPLRVVRVDQVARAGVSETIAVALHEGCVVVVDGGRPGIVSESTCRRLSADLLFADPLHAWFLNADALELAAAGEPAVPLQRAGEQWTRADGAELGPLAGTIRRLRAFEASDVIQGSPAGEPQWTLRVRPRRGPPFVVNIGANWAQVQGADWHYENARR